MLKLNTTEVPNLKQVLHTTKNKNLNITCALKNQTDRILEVYLKHL